MRNGAGWFESFKAHPQTRTSLGSVGLSSERNVFVSEEYSKYRRSLY